MDDQRLASLDPTFFFRGEGWFPDKAKTRRGVTEKFQTFYKTEAEEGAHAYDLDRISTGIFYLRTLLERHNLCGNEFTAVEIGCGTGNKSLCINDLFGQYFGVDLQRPQIETAKERAVKFQANNTQFICANAIDVFADRERYGLPKKVDLLILYAVLEHLTLTERMELLKVADTVMEDGGNVLVMETPNRLAPTDSHTSGVMYLNNLPDELAHQYWRRSNSRPDLCSALGEVYDAGSRETLYRLGRGVSFHDFELNLHHPIEHYSFIADAYEPEMLNIEPLTYQEFSLYGELTANVKDIEACVFSRYWLEFVMSLKRSDQKCKRIFVSPHWPNWLTLSDPIPFYGKVGKQISSSEGWGADVDIPFARDLTLVLNAHPATGRIRVLIDHELVDVLDMSALDSARPARWHSGFGVAFKIDRPIGNVAIALDGEGEITLQGCIISALSERS